MTDITIRQLTAADAPDYRRIRMKCLQEFPDAFRTTYAEESAKPVLFFENCLLAGDAHNVGFGAFSNDELIGIVCFGKIGGAKTDHVGEIRQMYVDPQFQNHGVGRRLVEIAVEYGFVQFPEIERITLGVIAGNPQALHLYERCGFVQFAYEKNYLKEGSRYFDLIAMEMGR